MKKSLILLLSTLLIVGTIIGGITCNNTDSGSSANVAFLIKKIPEGISSFAIIELEALRGDEDLEVILEECADTLDYYQDELGIDINDVNCFAIVSPLSIIYGDFDLDDIREELGDRYYSNYEYNNVEIWKGHIYENALTERDDVQITVSTAMADVQVGEVNAGVIDNTHTNTVTYDDGTILPIGDYIVGGLESLSYSYRVASDGQVTATNGPLWEDNEWTSSPPVSWIALIENLIIEGSEYEVKGCIRVIEEGEDSMLDDNDCKDIVDRLPNGIMIRYGTSEAYSDLEAFGNSLQKKDDDTLKMTAIFKFKDGDAADAAIDEIEDDLAEESDFTSINVHRSGEFVIVTVEIDNDDIHELLDQDRYQAAITELDDVQIAVIDATKEVPGGELDASGTIDSSACTLTYNGGTPFPVGDYIAGGLESLMYAYDISAEGHVTVTTGPLVRKINILCFKLY